MKSTEGQARHSWGRVAWVLALFCVAQTWSGHGLGSRGAVWAQSQWQEGDRRAAEGPTPAILEWIETGVFPLVRGTVRREQAYLDGIVVRDFSRASWQVSRTGHPESSAAFSHVPSAWRGTVAGAGRLLLTETGTRELALTHVSTAHVSTQHEFELGAAEDLYFLDSSTGVLRPAHRFEFQRAEPHEEREVLIDRLDGTVRLDRSLIRGIDLEGTVSGLASGAPFPYLGPASLVSLPLPYLTLAAVGLTPVTSDGAGEFVFPNVPGPVTVVATLSGPYFTVLNQAGPNAQFLGTLAPGAPQAVEFNVTPTEEVTAEVAAFHALGASRSFLETLSPGFAPGQVPVEAYVNQAGSCFAFYSPLFAAVYFTPAGNGCPNTSYSTIVSHEYFHHLAFQLGAFEEAYEEAMADVFAAYVFGTPTIGASFFGPGNDLRSLQGDLMFPNPSPEPAEEGLPLSQAFWDLRELLIGSLGSPAGENLAAELWLGSVLVGNGQLDESVLQQVLLLDDDDGDVANGTPHFTEIVNAFAPHGFAPPTPMVGDLVCALDESVATLTWALSGTGGFDSIAVLRNGSLLATLPGDAAGYLDVGPPEGSNFYAVTGISGSVSGPPEICTLTTPAFAPFLRGDVNLDGTLNLLDAVSLLQTLFQSVPATACFDALDVNDSGTLNLIDATTLLQHLFLSGPPPPPPHPTPGFDPTPDGQLCQ